MRRLIGILLTVLAPFGASAHEHWIDAETFYIDPSQEVDIRLCSGHHFPKSAFVLQDRVVSSVALRHPSGKETAIVTHEVEKHRVGTVSPTGPGPHLLSFALKRPRAAEPNYEGKAILVAGNDNTVDAYTTGRGLELVPQQVISGLRPGDVLPIVLCLDGQRVAGSLSASLAGGRTSLLSTGAERPAQLKLSGAGRYLVTASHEGRGCSLVFKVREAKER